MYAYTKLNISALSMQIYNYYRQFVVTHTLGNEVLDFKFCKLFAEDVFILGLRLTFVGIGFALTSYLLFACSLSCSCRSCIAILLIRETFGNSLRLMEEAVTLTGAHGVRNIHCASCGRTSEGYVNKSGQS